MCRTEGTNLSCRRSQIREVSRGSPPERGAGSRPLQVWARLCDLLPKKSREKEKKRTITLQWRIWQMPPCPWYLGHYHQLCPVNGWILCPPLDGVNRRALHLQEILPQTRNPRMVITTESQTEEHFTKYPTSAGNCPRHEKQDNTRGLS